MLAAPANAARPWPLTGRRTELAAAAQALDEGTADVILVTGPPGVGKSRLTRELLLRLDGRDRATAWVSGSRSTQRVPLGALAHVLPRVAPTDPGALLAEVRRVLGTRRATPADADGAPAVPEPRDPPEDPPAPAGDLVLALDDAHLLDATTASLLGPLVEAGGTRLVATLPDLAAAPDALQELWRAGRAYVLELGTLDDFAVDTLLHRALGGPVDGAAMLALLDASGGNALFLRELVLGSLTAGRLAEVDGVWRMTGEPEPSTMLRALVRARVSSLGPEVHALLEDLAIGAPVGLGDLVTRHGPEVLERAERAGLVLVREDGRRREVVLEHGLHGDVLRDGLGRVASARLSRTHADAVEARGSRRTGDPWRVALWRLRADGTAPVEVLMRAAMLARAARDLDAVERLARAAFDEGPDPTVARALAEVLYERGRFAEALDVVGAVSPDEGDPESAAVLASARATVLGFGLLRLDEAVSVLRAARDAAGEPGLRSRLAARLAAVEMWSGGPASALAELDAQPLDPSAAVADAAARAPLLALVGRTQEALDASTDEVAAVPGTPEAGRVLALLEAGRPDDAEALARQCHTASARARLPLPQLWFAGGLARVALRRGRAVDALRWFREQAGLSRDLDQGLPLGLALGGWMTAAVWCGDDAALEEAWAGWQASGLDVDGPTMLPADVASGHAWRLLQVGDLEAAHEVLDACVRRCLDAGHVAQAAAAAYERVRLLRPAAVVEDLQVLAGRSDSPVIAAWAEHATAAADGDGDRLEGVADRLWSLGLALSSIEASTAAAAAARRSGDPRRAQALARLAASRRSAVPGVTTPGLLAATSPQGGLTPREKEIALLVAQGRSSKEIAAALVLSVRTVDNHLQRVFAKLGVSSRAEVKDALEEGT